MEIYDHITADAIEENDCIFYSQDYIEVKTYIDGGPSILVHGFSHSKNDIVDYAIPADMEVGLWRF